MTPGPEGYFPQVYDELRRLAAAKLALERGDHTLNATALVHEAFLRLGGESFTSRSSYFRAAAQAMRRILVDHARRRQADKRGGKLQRISLDDSLCWSQHPDHLLALEETLERLSREEPRKAELVTLRFFAGMTLLEAAQVLDISVPTAERWWSFARTWLYAELSEKNI